MSNTTAVRLPSGDGKSRRLTKSQSGSAAHAVRSKADAAATTHRRTSVTQLRRIKRRTFVKELTGSAALPNAWPALRAKQPNATRVQLREANHHNAHHRGDQKFLPRVACSGTGIGRRSDARKPTVFVL